MIMKKIDNYIRFQATVMKEGIDKGEIRISEELLQEQKEGVIGHCLDLNPNMLRAEIGLRVDKIFADVLGME